MQTATLLARILAGGALVIVAGFAALSAPHDGAADSHSNISLDHIVRLPAMARDFADVTSILAYDGQPGSCTALQQVDFGGGPDTNGNPPPRLFSDDGGPGVHGVVNNNWDRGTMVDGFVEAWNFDAQGELESFATTPVIPGVIPTGRQGVYEFNLPANFPVTGSTRFTFCSGLVPANEAPLHAYDAEATLELLEEAGWTDVEVRLRELPFLQDVEFFTYHPGPGGPQGIFGGSLADAGREIGPNHNQFFAGPPGLDTPPLLIIDGVDPAFDPFFERTAEPVNIVSYSGGTELVFRTWSPFPVHDPVIDVELVAPGFDDTVPVTLPKDQHANEWLHFSLLVPGITPDKVEVLNVPGFGGGEVTDFGPLGLLQTGPTTTVLFADGFGQVTSCVFNPNSTSVNINGLPISFALVAPTGFDDGPAMVGRANTNGVGSIPAGGTYRATAQYSGPGVTDDANSWLFDQAAEPDEFDEDWRAYLTRSRTLGDLPGGPEDQYLFFYTGDVATWDSPTVRNDFP